MSSSLERIVIVGGGHAGVELAAALRHQRFAGTVSIVSDEADLPYQRPPLSKGLLVPGKPVLPLRGESFYAANEIHLHLGRRAQRIDRGVRRLQLADGGHLDYDHLILATGARNRVPDLPGLSETRRLDLRTLRDAYHLAGVLDGLRHVTVLGGGFIGLEVAGLLRERGIQVDVIEAAGRLMGRVLSCAMSEHFLLHHQQGGVGIRLGTTAARIAKRGRRFAITLADEDEIETDAVLVAIGVTPNAELAAEAGLKVENGIMVDEFLVTSDPSISAIGDCAFHANPFGKCRLRLESVQNAVDQAKTVAARLAGNPAPYRSLPWFWSNQGSARLQIAGLSIGCDDHVVRREPAGAGFSVFLYRGGELVAVESLNRPSDHMAARRLLAGGINVAKDIAGDPAVDLKNIAA